MLKEVCLDALAPLSHVGYGYSDRCQLALSTLADRHPSRSLHICVQALRLALREEQRQRRTLADGLEAERAATAAAVRKVADLVGCC
jgi:hypothetical protein